MAETFILADIRRSYLGKKQAEFYDYMDMGDYLRDNWPTWKAPATRAAPANPNNSPPPQNSSSSSRTPFRGFTYDNETPKQRKCGLNTAYDIEPKAHPKYRGKFFYDAGKHPDANKKNEERNNVCRRTRKEHEAAGAKHEKVRGYRAEDRQ